jgi:hypothetical protein
LRQSCIKNTRHPEQSQKSPAKPSSHNHTDERSFSGAKPQGFAPLKDDGGGGAPARDDGKGHIRSLELVWA